MVRVVGCGKLRQWQTRVPAHSTYKLLQPLKEPLTCRGRGSFKAFAFVCFEVTAFQEDEGLRFVRSCMCRDGEVGRGKKVLLRHDDTQRGWGYCVDMDCGFEIEIVFQGLQCDPVFKTVFRWRPWFFSKYLIESDAESRHGRPGGAK